MESTIQTEIEALPGVRKVTVVRTSNTFIATVQMDELKFSPFEKVVQKELDWSDRFPEMRFDFQVTPTVHGD